MRVTLYYNSNSEQRQQIESLAHLCTVMRSACSEAGVFSIAGLKAM